MTQYCAGGRRTGAVGPVGVDVGVDVVIVVVGPVGVPAFPLRYAS